MGRRCREFSCEGRSPMTHRAHCTAGEQRPVGSSKQLGVVLRPMSYLVKPCTLVQLQSCMRDSWAHPVRNHGPSTPGHVCCTALQVRFCDGTDTMAGLGVPPLRM